MIQNRLTCTIVYLIDKCGTLQQYMYLSSGAKNDGSLKISKLPKGVENDAPRKPLNLFSALCDIDLLKQVAITMLWHNGHWPRLP